LNGTPNLYAVLGGTAALTAFLGAALDAIERKGRLVAVDMAYAAAVYSCGYVQHPGAATCPSVRTLNGCVEATFPLTAALELVALASSSTHGTDDTLAHLHQRFSAALEEAASPTCAGQCPLSAEQVVRLCEAAHDTDLPGVATRPGRAVCGAQREHLRTCGFSASQALRLLATWAAGGVYKPTTADMKAMQACLRLRNLSGAELEAVAEATAAFPWPAVNCLPLLRAVAQAAAARWARCRPRQSSAAGPRWPSALFALYVWPPADPPYSCRPRLQAQRPG
jgi:hypothetical protein